MSDDSINPLRFLSVFDVGDWECAIWQQVSGALAWQALRLSVDEPKRGGVFPVGFSVDDAEQYLRNDKTLLEG